jgi:molybdenum cofactor cytidylyltransferase
MIAGLLLAAGGARRFGSQKLVAVFGDRPLVCHALDALAASCDVVVAVIGNEAGIVRRAIESRGVQIVENTRWETGLSSSLHCGIGALGADVDAVIVALGDEPQLDANVVRAIGDRWRQSPAPIVAARYRGVRGHPVLFDRALFAELRALQGDVGAKPLLRRLEERIVHVDIDADAPRDIDTVADLEWLSGNTSPD